jgi:hypothetical protein
MLSAPKPSLFNKSEPQIRRDSRITQYLKTQKGRPIGRPFLMKCEVLAMVSLAPNETHSYSQIQRCYKLAT